MNGKKAKAVRRATPPPTPKRLAFDARFWSSWKAGVAGLVVLVVLSLSFVLPGVLDKKTASPAGAHAMAAGVAQGDGMPAGSAVPSFSANDLLTSKPINSRSVYGHKTLLFFSEGVMCQACFQQIQGLQKVGLELKQRGIQLISVTPDSAGDLRQAVAQYGITTPMVSDSDRSMSEAFNTLGQGMHANTPGHAFALIYHGKVLWYRDYWRAPDRTMFVQPDKLLADIPTT